MSTFAERFRQEGIDQGIQQGEAAALIRLLRRKFGDIPVATRQRIEAADSETLLEWLDRVIAATSLEDVLH